MNCYCFIVGNDYTYGYLKDTIDDANISSNDFISLASTVTSMAYKGYNEGHSGEELYDYIKERSKDTSLKHTIEQFNDSKVINKITPSIKQNEVIFNCKNYVLIPITLRYSELLKSAGIIT